MFTLKMRVITFLVWVLFVYIVYPLFFAEEEKIGNNNYTYVSGMTILVSVLILTKLNISKISDYDAPAPPIVTDE
jgi:predicted ABC-type exoprotein transport system permease subunit